MSTRGPVARALIGFGLLCGVCLALAGGIVLHGSSLWLVGVAAGLVACVAFGARDGALDGGRAAAAWTAAASTVGAIMLVAGVVVLAGGALAAWASGLAVVVGAGWLLRARWARRAGAKALGPAPGRGDGGPARALPALLRGRSEFPVSLLPTSVLGSEWLQTTATLACRLEHAARQAIIGRRQEILDELEARDPAGFGRWLAAGAASDPATFVRFNRTMGTDAA
jgi:hypothetical protein